MTYLRKIKKEIRLFGYYDNKIQKIIFAIIKTSYQLTIKRFFYPNCRLFDKM